MSLVDGTGTAPTIHPPPDVQWVARPCMSKAYSPGAKSRDGVIPAVSAASRLPSGAPPTHVHSSDPGAGSLIPVGVATTTASSQVDRCRRQRLPAATSASCAALVTFWNVGGAGAAVGVTHSVVSAAGSSTERTSPAVAPAVEGTPGPVGPVGPMTWPTTKFDGGDDVSWCRCMTRLPFVSMRAPA